MKPSFGREGYLMIDHRASPGIPEDIARASGLDPRFAGEGKLLEQATLTCSHCKAAVVKNPMRIRERHSCVKCGGHYICDGCHAKSMEPLYQHTPFEKVKDTVLDYAARGISLGSSSDLLHSSIILP
jgi:hypothetical protein